MTPTALLMRKKATMSMNPRTHRIQTTRALFALLAAAAPAAAASYLEAFDAVGPSPLAAAGWSLVSGTNNPTTITDPPTANDAANVFCITSTDDLGSAFNSAHVFIEHDRIPADPNNFGPGDALIWTTKPLTDLGVPRIDLNGARLAVDYCNGNQFNSGPSFYFALRVYNSWYIYEEGQLGQTTSAVRTRWMSTDPLDDTFTFIPLIFEPNQNYNSDARLIPNDSLATELPASALANVTAVGLYVFGGVDALPSRFDNFRITDFYAPTPPCFGDANDDGTVNFADITATLANFGVACPPVPPLCSGDSDGSRTIDFSDITATLSNWGGTCP